MKTLTHVIARRSAVVALCVCACCLMVQAGCARDPQAKKARYLASAERYLAASKLHEAIIEYRNAVDHDPRSADVRAMPPSPSRRIARPRQSNT